MKWKNIYTSNVNGEQYSHRTSNEHSVGNAFRIGLQCFFEGAFKNVKLNCQHLNVNAFIHMRRSQFASIYRLKPIHLLSILLYFYNSRISRQTEETQTFSRVIINIQFLWKSLVRSISISWYNVANIIHNRTTLARERHTKNHTGQFKY